MAGLSACAPQPVAQPQAIASPPSDETLFVRLGGQRAIATLASDWSARLEGHQPPAAELAELICAASQGPCKAADVRGRWLATGRSDAQSALLILQLQLVLARCHVAVPESEELLQGLRHLMAQ